MTNAGYKNFNKTLRGEIAIMEKYKAFKELLNNALKKLPKTSSSTFYRLEKMSPEMLSKEYAIGKTIEKKGFTSSTYDYMAVEEMMVDDAGFNVFIKISGKNGKNIEATSKIPAEREVLFKSNTKFFVESINEVPKSSNPETKIYQIVLIEK
ncbi:ADP-ribosyltransferase domain-containing protein [Chryseobacterium sp. FH2]|uniref:ADP-ribosyltransferase domain-containing protein n=1 Tax=Chryseobacterium sp. FH2 TaxID=1674291 RepID=UPI0009E2C14F|nr:ADP-ribosyltransferase domain-containing protein [Chryseobacterium sp. FH2]